jgi:tetratricopeptide (TPR) repeat protein
MRRRRLKPVLARAVPAVLAVLALAGCRAQETWDRFRAERMFWKANMEMRRLQVNPVIARDEDYEKALGAFEAIAGKFPPPAVRDTLEIHGQDARILARISGRALLQSARFRSQLGQTDRAAALCGRVLDEYAFDAALGIEARYLKGVVYERANDAVRAIAEYERLLSEQAPALRAGDVPLQEVLELPLRIVAYYEGVGDTATARGRTAGARDYYRRIIREFEGTSTAAAARMKLSAAFAGERRHAEAIGVLEELVGNPLLSAVEASEVDFAIGTLYEDGLRDHAKALEVFGRILDGGGQGPIAARTQLMIAAIYRETGDLPRAIEEFRKVPARFPADLESGAAAQFQIAQILESQEQWEEALNEYTATGVSFPRTRYGLMAPFAVAQHYRKTGDMEAASLAFERAVEGYRDIVQKNPGTPLAAQAQDAICQVRILEEKWPEAAQEFETYGDSYPLTPVAPLALLRAAALCERKLGDRERAGRILDKISTRYAGTPVARRADAERLRLRGGAG